MTAPSPVPDYPAELIKRRVLLFRLLSELDQGRIAKFARTWGDFRKLKPVVTVRAINGRHLLTALRDLTGYDAPADGRFRAADRTVLGGAEMSVLLEGLLLAQAKGLSPAVIAEAAADVFVAKASVYGKAPDRDGVRDDYKKIAQILLKDPKTPAPKVEEMIAAAQKLVDAKKASLSGAVILSLKQLVAPKMELKEYGVKRAWLVEEFFFSLLPIAAAAILGMGRDGLIVVLAATRAFFFLWHARQEPEGSSGIVHQLAAPFIVSVLPFLAFLAPAGVTAAVIYIAAGLVTHLIVNVIALTDLWRPASLGRNPQAVSAGKAMKALLAADSLVPVESRRLGEMDQDGIIRALPGLMERTEDREAFFEALGSYPDAAHAFGALAGTDAQKTQVMVQLTGKSAAEAEALAALVDRTGKAGWRLVLAAEAPETLSGVKESEFVHVAGRPKPRWLEGDLSVTLRRDADVDDAAAAVLIGKLPLREDLLKRLRDLLRSLPPAPADFRSLIEAARAVARYA